MKKYHVAVEAFQPSALSAFSPLGFGIKYLDMRKIQHRDALEINVTDCTVKLSGRASKQQDSIRHGLYNMNQRNKKKLNRALELLDNMKTDKK